MVLEQIYKFLNKHYSLKVKAKIACFLFSNPFRKNKAPALLKGKCNICGRRTVFWDFSGNPETFFCHHCGSSARNRAIGKLILMERDPAGESIKSMRRDKDMSGYIASGYGALAKILKTKNFIISEYFEDLPVGSVSDGIRREDLTGMTFPDETFDIAITESVLEHVNDPFKSFAEVNRVLKKSGIYLFTIPFESIGETVTRTLPDGTAVMPEQFHIDPLKPGGALVYTQFSKRDIMKKFLEPNRFKAEILTLNDKETGIFDCDVVRAEKTGNL